MLLTDECFSNADKAREYLEACRWPDGPVCPHCGAFDQDRITALKGKAHRVGLYQCADCRGQFTVTKDTVMEDSKIPLHKWLLAIHLMGASKKGMSAHQLHRQLGITYQSAWFLCHRIREAMREDGPGLLGGGGKVVEADETYYGKAETVRPRNKYLPNPPRAARSALAASVRSSRLWSAVATCARFMWSAPTRTP
jgi:transposase-like protein